MSHTEFVSEIALSASVTSTPAVDLVLGGATKPGLTRVTGWSGTFRRRSLGRSGLPLDAIVPA